MDRPRRIVSLRDGPCNPDSRVMRHADTLTAAGYDVTVVCKLVEGVPDDETLDGVRYIRVPMRARALRPRSGLFKFRAFERFVAPTVKRLAPDVVDAHDLITLPGASRIAAAIGAKILYDVHDLYLHQPKRRGMLARWQAARLERRYIRQADAVITVSDGMADHLRDAYGIPRPDVVLNSPVDSVPSDDVRRDLRSELRLAPDIPLGVYTGARSISRNLDRLVRALAEVPGLHVALVGHPQTVDDNRLRALADAGGCADRVHILPPVPHEIVSAYISTADFGILPYNGECLNHDVTLPTKLFESVFAGLPVAVSELPALKDFVGRTGTGLAMDSLDEASIATTLRRMAKDRQGMRLPPAKTETLRKIYGWPAQARILLGIYDRLFGAEARTPRPVEPV